MSDIDCRLIIKSLKKKGFVENPGDHQYFHFEHAGKAYKHIVAKVSRGSGYKTYGQNLWCKMTQRLQLDGNKQTHDLLTCPLDKDGYLEVLRKKGTVQNDKVALKKGDTKKQSSCKKKKATRKKKAG